MGKGENEERMRRVSTKRGPHYVILKVEQKKCRLIDITLIDIFAPRVPEIFVESLMANDLPPLKLRYNTFYWTT